MKDWKRRINEFLRANSSEQSVDDGQLLNLISELIQEEKLSVDEKSILLELKNSNGSTLNNLAERSIKNSTPLQQLISYSKKLFKASSCLDITDEALTKENGILNHVAVEAEEITVSLKKQVYQLIINYDDIEKFARTFLADFQLTLEAFKVLSDKLEAITKRLVRISNQLIPLTQAIHMLIERSNDIDISKLSAIFLKKLLAVQEQCHVISQKLSATQQKHAQVSKKLSNTRTHFLVASQNITNYSLRKNKKILDSPIEHAKQALTIMGFTPAASTTNTNSSSSKDEGQSNTMDLRKMIEQLVDNAIVDETILTATPPNPDTIYQVLVAINKSSNSSSNIPASSSSSTTPTTYTSATKSASSNSNSTRNNFFTENSNTKSIEKFKQKIDGLLDPSIHLAKDKRLVNLLNGLANLKSLSATEKFELLLHTAQDGNPRVLTTYVAIALYCEKPVIEKLVNLLTAMQNALSTGLDEFRSTLRTSYPYFDYDTFFSDILNYGEIQEDIRQELFDFLQNLGVVRAVGHGVFIFLRSHSVFDVFDEPLTALCRLCLNNNQSNAEVENFDSYYYYKIADRGESLTGAEQRKLSLYISSILSYILTFQHIEKKAVLERCVNPETSLGKVFACGSDLAVLNKARFELNELNSANATVGINTQSSSSSTNSFSSTNTSILTKIVESLWQLFQAIECFDENELANLSCSPKLVNEIDDTVTDDDTEEYNIENAKQGEETSCGCGH
jgi:hypothetical protein